MSQFSCLLWKERRQARFVLVGCLLVALLIPLVVILAGSTLPDSEERWYLREEAVGVIVPLTCVLVLWPLIALVAAVQLFGGDLAAGTERLLRHAPVSAMRVWFARLLLAATMLLAAGAASCLSWWIGGALAAPAGFAKLPELPAWLEVSALLLGPLALACGALACSLRTHSLAALLVGGGLTTGLAIAGVRLASLSPWLAPLLVPVGALEILCLLACSLVMEARGEPAGRGRFARGALALAGCTITLALLTVTSAPVYLRSCFDVSQVSFVEVSPTGERAVAETNGSLWLLDVASGRREKFFPPYVLAAAWDDGGERFALASLAGLVTLRRDPRLLIIDSHTGRELSRHPLPAGFWPYRLLWWRGHLVLHGTVASGQDSAQQWTMILDPRPGAVPRRIAAGASRPRAVLRAAEGGPLILLMPGAGSGEMLEEFRILRLDDPDAVPTEVGFTQSREWADFTVSPSGRARWTTGDEDNPTLAIEHLELSSLVKLDRPWSSGPQRRPPRCWLGDDRLAWLQGDGAVPARLVISASDGSTLATMPFTEPATWLACEPGGDRLLLYRFDALGEGSAAGWIADFGTGVVRPLLRETKHPLIWAGRGWLMAKESAESAPSLIAAGALDREIPMR